MPGGCLFFLLHQQYVYIYIYIRICIFVWQIPVSWMFAKLSLQSTLKFSSRLQIFVFVDETGDSCDGDSWCVRPMQAFGIVWVEATWNVKEEDTSNSSNFLLISKGNWTQPPILSLLYHFPMNLRVASSFGESLLEWPRWMFNILSFKVTFERWQCRGYL